MTVDAGEFSGYEVVAYYEGEATEAVLGEFQVGVTPTDAYGNPSVKVYDRAVDVSSVDTLTASRNLLDTRVPVGNVLEMAFVEFSANTADASVPAGPQKVLPGGSSFICVAPDRAGEGLVIQVRTFNATADTTGVTKAQDVAFGTTGPLQFVSYVIDRFPPERAAPDTLIVRDYLGANGEGDQGRYVLVTFPESVDHDLLTQYRIYRAIMVEEDSVQVQRFVPWGVVSAVPGREGDEGLVRVVVPALDNVKTRWGVAGEWGGRTVEQVLAKTASQVPGPRFQATPSSFARSASEDKKASPVPGPPSPVNGEVKGVPPGTISLVPNSESEANPPRPPFTKRGDGPPAMETGAGRGISLAKGVTTLGQGIQSTEMVVSEVAGAADNIPPAAVTELSIDVVEPSIGSATSGRRLTWTASVDDKAVGSVSYRGYSVPIPGVERYEVVRGASPENMTVIGLVEAGTTEFVDDALPDGHSNLSYRVDALDLDNRSSSDTVILMVSPVRMKYVDAEGNPVYIVKFDGDTPTVEDFEDFVAFAQSYGIKSDEPGYNMQADTNDDGVVNFNDFINFAQAYGNEAAELGDSLWQRSGDDERDTDWLNGDGVDGGW